MNMDTTATEEEVYQIDGEGDKTKVEGKEEVIEEPFQFEATIKKENIEDFLKSISILVEEGRMTINENGIVS
jgi:predicted nucleotidyltransferase